jgi:exopolysaccharide biosynthesis polyprenyl glycosylphosphotransferase
VSSLPAVFDQVDERTLEILERRRSVAGLKRRGWLVRRALLTADLVGLATAFAVASLVYGVGGARSNHLGQFGEYALFLLALPVWVVAAKLYGLYDRDEERTDHSTADDFAGVFHLVTVWSWLLFATAYLVPIAKPAFPKVLVFWLVAVVLITGGRALGRSYCRRRLEYLQNTAIVGAGDVGQMVARKLLNHPEYGLNLVGFIDAEPREPADDLEHVPLLGGADELPQIVQLLDIERVVLAFSNGRDTDMLSLVRALGELDVQVDIVPRLFETVGLNVGVHTIEGVPLVGLPPLRLSRSSSVIKRALDVSLATAALVVLAPVLLVIAVAVRLDSAGPVLYRHERVGRNRKRIEVMKFRTMRLEASRGARYGGDRAEEVFASLMADAGNAAEFEKGQKLRKDPRVTRVGGFLRATSLDELPQLFNVVVGDLSLVGPRAITIDELVRYGDDVEQLLSVRPGVTGYWQVNGRSRLAYEDRVRLDLSYIRGWSLGLDLVVIGRTIRVLLARQDAY